MAQFLKIINGIPTMIQVDSFDESIAYASGLLAETAITIPNSKTFQKANASDILIIVNNTLREYSKDFTVVGAGPEYSQIQFNYDLPDNTHVRFKKLVQ